MVNADKNVETVFALDEIACLMSAEHASRRYRSLTGSPVAELKQVVNFVC